MMQRASSRLTFFGTVFLAVFVGAFASPAAAQSGGGYDLSWNVIAGGGWTSSVGGSYELGGTAGQAAAWTVPMTGGSYSLTGGFWQPFESGPVVCLRGDADGSGVVNVSDVFFLINNLFAGGPAPAAVRCGDADSSGILNVSDVFYLINYLFAGGPAPAP